MPCRSTPSLSLAALLSCGLALSTIPSLASEKTVHVFKGEKDGAQPASELIADANGNLYGTTEAGGDGCSAGCGTVFEITPAGKESVLYGFRGGSDGISPVDAPLIDGSGGLVGTTAGGGGNGCAGYGCGTIYGLAPDGTETVLYAFQGQGDGSYPFGGVVEDANGDLFGTTGDGGNFGGVCGSYGCGTVFELTANGSLKTLYAFRGKSDGSIPGGGVILDSAGNLYGTTYYGGNKSANCNGIGCGVVFEISANGAYTVLYTFQGGADGDSPEAGLVADAAGNLYGTTTFGGNAPACGSNGCGTVFEVSPSGQEKILHAFQSGSDGLAPEASVVLDNAGNIYGTTYYGGSTSCKISGHIGCGTVFEVTPDGKETLLYVFRDHGTKPRGAYPAAGLFLDSNGALYGTTSAGGKDKDGVVFRVTPK